MVEIEDIGYREMETIASRVKETMLKKEKDIAQHYMHCSTN